MVRKVAKGSGSGKRKWNFTRPPRLIAIDINAPSDLYPGSVSAYNTWEAAFVVWLHDQLLAAPAPTGGRKVRRDAITIILPYRGQVQRLNDEYTSRPTPTVPHITTIRGAAGAESNIGISTSAKNDPANVAVTAFVAQVESLNVWMTRQQRFHFFVSPWMLRYHGRTAIERSAWTKTTYVSLVEQFCNGTDDVVVLRPEDFASFPPAWGFSPCGVVAIEKPPEPLEGLSFPQRARCPTTVR